MAGLSKDRLSKKTQAAVLMVLLGLNLVCANALLQPIAGARLDLTEQKEYTVSEVTKTLLSSLPDRVSIYGYFSAKTHEKLGPLVPKIQDLLEEYRVYGGDKLVVHFADPKSDEEIEKEAYDRFGVRPTPFQVQSKYEAGVQSAYFHIVIAYGDQHETLDVGKLVTAERGGDGELVVKLQNLEYQLTRAIQKVVRGFGSLEARLAELDTPIEVTAFLSEAPELKEDADGRVKEFLDKKKKLLKGVADQLKERYKKGLKTERLDPSASAEARKKAAQYRLRPVQASFEDQTLLYVGLVVRYQKRAEQIPLLGAGDLSPADVVQSVEASIRRLVPGALKRIGLVTDKPNIPPQQLLQMQMRGQRPPSDSFETLRQALGESFEVRDVKLDSGRPPAQVDVLLVLRPKALTEKQRFALDQYLMLGYPVILFLDRTELDMQGSRQELRLKSFDPGIDAMLQHYGVTLQTSLVEDETCLSFPLPRIRNLGGIRIREIVEAAYPWFLDVRGDGIDRDSPALSGVERIGLMWASPLTIDEKKQPGAHYQTLVRSSEKSWTTADLRNAAVPDKVIAPEKTARQILAVAVTGQLTSFFQGKKNPLAEEVEKKADPKNPEKDADSLEAAAKGSATSSAPSLEPLESSPDGTRLVILGDADLVSDIAKNVLGPTFAENVGLVHNLVDWALMDEGLIQIRSRGVQERPLEKLERSKKKWIELVNYLVPFLLVIAFGIARFVLRSAASRRRRRPETGEKEVSA